MVDVFPVYLRFQYLAAADISLTAYLFQAYVNATGATDHNDGNGYVLTPAQFSNLKNLTFTFGTCPKCFHTDLVPDAQIRPRASSSGPIRIAISQAVGTQMTLGNAFLERYYVYLDVSRCIMNEDMTLIFSSFSQGH